MCTPRSPLSSFRGIVGRDGDGFVMRDTSTDESSELTSKTRSCASIKPAIFLASRTRRVDRARWYSMRALISTRVCDKMHRRTRASVSCFSMCLHWITDAKIETKEGSSYCSVHGSTRELSARQKVCARRLKRELLEDHGNLLFFRNSSIRFLPSTHGQTKLLLGEKSEVTEVAIDRILSFDLSQRGSRHWIQQGIRSAWHAVYRIRAANTCPCRTYGSHMQAQVRTRARHTYV